jgi:TolB-like protein/Tfp pilus assembly protein PilF
MSKAFPKVRDRKIIHWAIAYIGGAWCVLQLLEVLETPLGITTSSWILVGILLTTGFVVTLVLAWYHGEKGRQRATGPELIIIGALLAIGGSALGATLGPGGTGTAPLVESGNEPAPDRMRVAVLPFANLSPQAEDAFFADGMHDEIISRLTRIGSLGVISRTSVMGYRSPERNLRSIAAELGAGTILEGSVRRAGNRVRLTAQLIDAVNDVHLWSDSFEAELTAETLFTIQIQIAGAVAAALQARLTQDELARVEDRPTRSLKAYEFYLMGNAARERGYGERDLRHAIAMYEQAVELDPSFALAAARLSRVHDEMIWFAHDRSPARELVTKATLDRAISLESTAVPVMQAAGTYHYHRARYDSAMHWIERARNLQPNTADITSDLAFIKRRQGRFDETAELLELARVTDPTSARALFNLAETYDLLGRCDDARWAFRQAAAAMPSWPRPPAYQAWLEVACTGDVKVARGILHDALPRLIDPHDDSFFPWNGFRIELLARDYDAALRWLHARESLSDQFFYRPVTLLRAEVYLLQGERGRGRAALDSARLTLEAKLGEAPADERYHGALALVLAYQGERDAAIRAGRRSAEIVEGRDQYKVIYREEELARVHAILGDHREAAAMFEHLLKKPGTLSVQILRLDPRLQALRESGALRGLLQ